MKKQINPTIKAHVIRGAFYLLLLIAVCAIPFALAQRHSIKRGVANPASNPNTASQLLPYDLPGTSIPTAGGLHQVYRINGTIGSSVSTPSDCIITGTIDTSDLTQTDRLGRSGIPQTCPASTTCAIQSIPMTPNYDAYTFTNNTGASQCVTVDTNTDCTGAHSIFVAAYLGSFDPAHICTNWIGDAGSSPNPDQAFSFDVDNGQTFVVVVSEVFPTSGCPSYTVTITPSSICGGTPTPTPTGTATATPTGTGTATATPTATPTSTPCNGRCSPTPRPRPTPAPRPTP